MGASTTQVALLQKCNHQLAVAASETIRQLQHSAGAHAAPGHLYVDQFGPHTSSTCALAGHTKTTATYRKLLAEPCRCVVADVPAPDGTFAPTTSRHNRLLAATCRLWSVAQQFLYTADGGCPRHKARRGCNKAYPPLAHLTMTAAFHRRQLQQAADLLHPDDRPQLTNHTHLLAGTLNDVQRQTSAVTFDDPTWRRQLQYRYIPGVLRRTLARMTSSRPHSWHPTTTCVLLLRTPTELPHPTTLRGDANYLNDVFSHRLPTDLVRQHAHDTYQHNRLLLTLTPAPTAALPPKRQLIGCWRPNDLPRLLHTNDSGVLQLDTTVAETALKTFDGDQIRSVGGATSGDMAFQQHLDAVDAALS